jgi:hypothetical protein
MPLVTVIGRGHSGTRAISHTLYASGVYMGACLNRSGDLIPPEAMYDACRVLARYVTWTGGLTWDFSRLFSEQIPDEFTRLLRTYLRSVLDEHAKTPDALVGWKIPETTLVYPWVQRLFPEVKYIFWIRDPRDCVLNRHITDDLHTFGIDYPPADDIRLRRAISWKYQYDLVKATPRPAHWIEVRFEDFVLRQEETLARLEAYLGIPLGRIIVRPDAVERYKLDDGLHDFDCFAPALAEYGYV